MHFYLAMPFTELLLLLTLLYHTVYTLYIKCTMCKFNGSTIDPFRPFQTCVLIITRTKPTARLLVSLNKLINESWNAQRAATVMSFFFFFNGSELIESAFSSRSLTCLTRSPRFTQRKITLMKLHRLYRSRIEYVST